MGERRPRRLPAPPRQRPRPLSGSTSCAPVSPCGRSPPPSAPALYWRDIADLNGIEHPALIHPGTVLRLPVGCEVPEHVAYIVVPGDTLGAIAAANGKTLAQIMEVNPGLLDHPDLIAVGMLTWPGGRPNV